MVIICIFCAQPARAENSYGVGLGYAGGPSGVDNANKAKGLRLTFDDYLLPNQWHHFQLFLQASTVFYHSSYEPLTAPHTDNLWVFALAPVIRYHFSPQASVDPFIDMSSGPGYLSAIYYENRNLGIHFTVQNMLGVGVAFGEEHQFAAALQFFHYSNAGISDHNRGLTAPTILSMTYQF